ncbi:MAG: GNAT family N-acetyltransferase [Acidobacteriaceae bacterium]
MIILETERLLFRPHEPGDLDAYCAMEQDPEVRRHVGGYPRTRDAAEARFPRSQNLAPDRLGVWATVLKSDDAYIGRCGVYPHIQHDTPIPGEGVLSYYIARPYWNHGFATEAAAAFVQFGFEVLKLQKIVTAVQAGNQASVRILQKLHFELLRTEEGPRIFLHFALQRPENQQ